MLMIPTIKIYIGLSLLIFLDFLIDQMYLQLRYNTPVWQYRKWKTKVKILLLFLEFDSFQLFELTLFQWLEIKDLSFQLVVKKG